MTKIKKKFKLLYQSLLFDMFPKLYTFPYVNEELGTLLVSQGSYKNEKKITWNKIKKKK